MIRKEMIVRCFLPALFAVGMIGCGAKPIQSDQSNVPPFGGSPTITDHERGSGFRQSIVLDRDLSNAHAWLNFHEFVDLEVNGVDVFQIGFSYNGSDFTTKIQIIDKTTQNHSNPLTNEQFTAAFIMSYIFAANGGFDNSATRVVGVVPDAYNVFFVNQSLAKAGYVQTVHAETRSSSGEMNNVSSSFVNVTGDALLRTLVEICQATSIVPSDSEPHETNVPKEIYCNSAKYLFAAIITGEPYDTYVFSLSRQVMVNPEDGAGYPFLIVSSDIYLELTELYNLLLPPNSIRPS